jgi:hypothetical protein
MLDCGSMDFYDRDSWDNDLFSEDGQARTYQDCSLSSAFETILANV